MSFADTAAVFPIANFTHIEYVCIYGDLVIGINHNIGFKIYFIYRPITGRPRECWWVWAY